MIKGNRESMGPYPGGKGASGVHQNIINLMPPHDIYIEPFLGHGEIFRRKKPASFNILADASLKVILKWTNRIDNNNTVIYRFDSVEFLKYADIFINYLHSRLQFGRKKILIYLDPPYLKETRKSQRNIYDYELSRDQHESMLKNIVRLHCYVMVSHYKCELYDKYLDNWNTHSFESHTRSGNAVETVYFNYPFPDLLHDYQYLGEGFRDRANLKARKNRIIKSFEKMKPSFRNSVIEGITNKFKSNDNI